MCSDITAGDKPKRGPLVMTAGQQDFPKIIADTVASVKKLALPVSQRLCSVRGSMSPGILWDLTQPWNAATPTWLKNRNAMLCMCLLRYCWRYRLFQFCPCSRAASRSFTNAAFKERGWGHMTWPLWGKPLPLPVVTSLLATFRVEQAKGKARDLLAAYSSERSAIETAAATYYVLRAGRRLW